MPDSITLTLPASVAADIPVMAQRLVDRMHELLERNTDAQLTPAEREDAEALVEMAEIAQLLASAVRKAGPLTSPPSRNPCGLRVSAATVAGASTVAT